MKITFHNDNGVLTVSHCSFSLRELYVVYSFIINRSRLYLSKARGDGFPERRDVFFKAILNSSKRSTNSTITMGFLLFLIVVLVSANSTSFTASVSTDEDYIDPKFAEMAFQSDGDVFSKRY